MIVGTASSLPMVLFVGLLTVLRAKSGAAVQTPYDLVALAQRQLTIHCRAGWGGWRWSGPWCAWAAFRSTFGLCR
jgi:hypothetical protein